MPEAVAVNLRNRSFSIGAVVDLAEPGATGVLFSHGGRFGGHSLYVKDNRLHYVYNFLGSEQQKIDATEDLPIGENMILAANFREGRRGSAGHCARVLARPLLRRSESR